MPLAERMNGAISVRFELGGNTAEMPVGFPNRKIPIALTGAPLIVHATVVLREGEQLDCPDAQPSTRGTVGAHAPATEQ